MKKFFAGVRHICRLARPNTLPSVSHSPPSPLHPLNLDTAHSPDLPSLIFSQGIELAIAGPKLTAARPTPVSFVLLVWTQSKSRFTLASSPCHAERRRGIAFD
jgi:hypothetical protein